MSGPWEKYAGNSAVNSGPWEKYSPKSAPEDHNIESDRGGDSILDRLKQGAQKFYIGTGQVANELTDKLGIGDYDIQNMQRITPEQVKERRQKFADASKLLAEQEGDVGIGGSIVQSLGDPLTYLGGAALKGPLALQGAVAGGASGFLSPSSDEEQTISDRSIQGGKGAAIGAVVAPIAGKIADVAISPRQALSDAGAAIGKALRVNPGKLSTFKQAGISPTVADISDSKVVKRAQNMLGDVPISSQVFDRAKNKVDEQVIKKLSEAGYDPTLDRAVGGDITRTGIKSYIDRGRALFEKAYNKFEQENFKPGELTEAPSTIKTIDKILSRADTKEALDAYLGSQDKSIIAKLKALTTASSEKTGLLDAEGNPLKREVAPRLTFNDLRLLRTSVGKKLEDYTIGTSDKAVLRELYGSMTADMRQKSTTKGPSIVEAFDRLNNNYAKFSTKIDDTLSEVLNKGESSEIFNAVSRGLPLPERTTTIMRSLSGDKRMILRGALIRELGIDRSVKGGSEFSPQRFSNKFLGLEKKAQDSLLFGMPAATKDNFKKVVDSVRYTSETSLQGNPSGTARNALLLSTAVGAYQNPMIVIPTIASAGITAKMMTNPRFLSWLANSPKGMTSNPARYIGLLSGIAASNNEISDDVNELRNSLESTDLTRTPQGIKSSQ